MPKYVVQVERLVPQWIQIFVEADCPQQILVNRSKVFEHACSLPNWEYEDDSERANEHPRVIVQGTVTPETEPDLRLSGSKDKDEEQGVVCDSCGTLFVKNDIKVQYPDIPNLLERMDPGGEVPFGECPECDALVYLTDITNPE